MEITPEASLQIVVDLLKRAPMTNAESVGAQVAVDCLEKTNKEWRDFKKTSAPGPS